MNFWCALVFSREFRRPKGAKPKHIFEIWCWRVVSCAPLAVVFHRVHWVAGGRLLWLVLLSCRVPRLLSSLLLCLWCFTLEYGFISRFKGVFSAFWGVDVCLYGFGVLLGLWGFCARVELGGFGACGVFALRFLLFSSYPLFFSFRPALVLLPCLASVLGFPSVGVIVSFSLSDVYAKRKGAKCFCVLSCPVVGLFRCH